MQALFHTYYGWNSAHTGVALSVSTTVGGVLGEIMAGQVTDKLMRSARKHANGQVKPESRLHAMWSGLISMPIGLVIFGAMIRFHSVENSWVGACIAIGVTGFATQVVITSVRGIISEDFLYANAARVSHTLSIATNPKLLIVSKS